MSRFTEQARSVSDALDTRFSCRAFKDTPVPEEDIRAILNTAMRAPSGGNLQPWHVWVAQGAPLADFVASIKEKMAETPGGEGSEYHIYPPDLIDPYNTRRRDLGEHERVGRRAHLEAVPPLVRAHELAHRVAVRAELGRAAVDAAVAAAKSVVNVSTASFKDWKLAFTSFIPLIPLFANEFGAVTPSASARAEKLSFTWVASATSPFVNSWGIVTPWASARLPEQSVIASARP